MTTRPKTRVLVRWNGISDEDVMKQILNSLDDLDKSLLLFITHTCAEQGIKIPYDEVARRMGSTFSEGAIQQHISKLRNKMAELNVAPVPAPPKRGTVTNKPSSIYAQKNRSTTAPRQPLPSKAQSRAASRLQSGDGTFAAPATKRSTKRKATTIKRSESDENESGDEFGGGSDDDFAANTNANGKRGRAKGRDGRGRNAKKVNGSQYAGMTDTQKIIRALKDADAQYDALYGPDSGTLEDDRARLWVQPSVEGSEGATSIPNIPNDYGQASQRSSWGEIEEEEQPANTSTHQATYQTTFLPPVDSSYDEEISPTSFSRTPIQFNQYSQYNDTQSTFSPYGGNFQHMSPIVNPPNSVFVTNSFSDYGSHGYPTNQAISSFQPPNINSQMPSPTYPTTAFPAMLNQFTSDPSTRNHSMVSSSSQSTFDQTQTPVGISLHGMNDQTVSPINQWNGSNFMNTSAVPSQMLNGWDTGNVDMTDGNENGLFGQDAVGESFMHQLFD